MKSSLMKGIMGAQRGHTELKKTMAGPVVACHLQIIEIPSNGISGNLSSAASSIGRGIKQRMPASLLSLSFERLWQAQSPVRFHKSACTQGMQASNAGCW